MKVASNKKINVNGFTLSYYTSKGEDNNKKKKNVPITRILNSLYYTTHDLGYKLLLAT